MDKKINDRSRKLNPFVEHEDDSMVICRCEEVTKGDIRKAVYDGMFTLQEVRKFLRTGMGLCQGQTCGKLVKNIIASELDISPAKLDSATGRAPMRPVEMEVLANDREGG
ncbi:MAG: (2Fe-2S)-binding protein [Halanaerobiales bacterium]